MPQNRAFLNFLSTCAKLSCFPSADSQGTNRTGALLQCTALRTAFDPFTGMHHDSYRIPLAYKAKQKYAHAVSGRRETVLPQVDQLLRSHACGLQQSSELAV